MRHTTPARRAALVGVVALVGLTACQSEPRIDTSTGAPRLDAALVSFDSCSQAEEELRAATAESIGNSGFGLETRTIEDGVMAVDAESKPAMAPGETGEFSGTNVQEAGIDEPDVVKTDGRRVVAIAGGELYVVDAASPRVIGSLDLSRDGSYGDATMLWHGDRVLLIDHTWEPIAEAPKDTDMGGGTVMTLVDISGEPKVIDEYAIDGVHLDSRARDGIVRVVVRSTPTIVFEPGWFFEDELDVARDTVMDSPIDAWLPDYELNGEHGQVGCRALARPTDFSGTSTMTILSFDLQKGLDDGSPLTIAADGDTVYGTADALYVANDRTSIMPLETTDESASAGTEIYRFSIDGPTLRHHSDVTVDGWLLNKYAMSEWNGHLRVATTLRPAWDATDSVGSTSSSVHVLAIGEDSMTPVGRLDGLGVDERIFAVRYIGPTAYVVTFRETDPLYVVDLTDPAEPTALGELKIPGYSAYLHPVGDGRLVGVGQDADENGRRLGTQVSLFDVSDPSAPTRVDVYTRPDTWTSVEFDPHAFLYWNDTLVIPISDDGASRMIRLRIDDDSFTELSTVEHRDSVTGPFRALAINDTLWTMSDAGLLVGSLTGDDAGAWVAFD